MIQCSILSDDKDDSIINTCGALDQVEICSDDSYIQYLDAMIQCSLPSLHEGFQSCVDTLCDNHSSSRNKFETHGFQKRLALISSKEKIQTTKLNRKCDHDTAQKHIKSPSIHTCSSGSEHEIESIDFDGFVNPVWFIENKQFSEASDDISPVNTSSVISIADSSIFSGIWTNRTKGCYVSLSTSGIKYDTVENKHTIKKVFINKDNSSGHKLFLA